MYTTPVSVPFTLPPTKYNTSPYRKDFLLTLLALQMCYLQLQCHLLLKIVEKALNRMAKGGFTYFPTEG